MKNKKAALSLYFLLICGLSCEGCVGVTTVSSKSPGSSSAPTVSITSPSSGATVAGTITVVTNVSANTTSVQFMVDGNNTGAAVTSAPFSLSLNTTTLSNGSHMLTAVASNAAGQMTTSAGVSISVNNVGVTPPTVSITSPSSGATVAGTITVVTNVSANTTSVQFMVDGSNTGAAVTSAPFSFSLNTTTLPNGAHALTAVASNSAGQSTTSASVAIMVNNPHLSITTSSLSSGQVQVSYSASLQATGGITPYTWSVLGQLPTGLNLSTSSGIISGTPTVAGSFSFTIQVSDSAGATASAGFSITITTSQPPLTAPFGHVYIVAEENTNYTDVIGTSAMPYLNSLVSQYGLATQYYADTHPSIGNYFMWTTGQILTNDDNQLPATFPISADNAVREVLAVGKSWKQYAESIPSVGYTGGDTVGPDGGNFATHHTPLLYMSDVLNSPAQLQNIVPFTQFATDLASGNMPNYAFVTPNMCDDAHDCSLTVADNWLQTNIDPLIKSAQFQKDGLLVIAFDESGNDNTNGGGRVVAVIISPFAKPGYQSTTFYQHESVLRLMLEGLGIRTLPGAATTAPKMWEFFTFSPPT